jgi:hypothetical protein
MGVLVFKMEDLKPIIEFAEAQRVAGKPFVQPYVSEDNGAPNLTLVHDEGVYLMSGTKERQFKNPEAEEGKRRCVVAYANGCDPTKQEFDDWWDTSRDIVGGDDFAEAIPLAFFVDAMNRQATAVKITMFKTKYRLTAVLPKGSVWEPAGRR